MVSRLTVLELWRLRSASRYFRRACDATLKAMSPAALSAGRRWAMAALKGARARLTRDPCLPGQPVQQPPQPCGAWYMQVG